MPCSPPCAPTRRRCKARLSPARRSASACACRATRAPSCSRGDRLDELRTWLDGRGLYVFTMNGFPHGTFHGAPVKAEVHAPDWRSDERVAYTLRLVEILAALRAGGGATGRISTSPLSYGRGSATTGGVGALHARNVRPRRRRRSSGSARSAACTRARARAGGRRARWPTSTDLIALVARRGSTASTSRSASTRATRRSPTRSPTRCSTRSTRRASGSARSRSSAALRVPPATPRGARAAAVRRPDLPAPGHRAQRDGSLHSWPDLPEALDGSSTAAQEWRMHFHVPIFVERYGALGSTQDHLREVIELRARAGGLGTWRSRPTRGTCCPPSSRPRRTTRSRASTSGCSVSSADAAALGEPGLARLAPARADLEHADGRVEHGGRRRARRRGPRRPAGRRRRGGDGALLHGGDDPQRRAGPASSTAASGPSGRCPRARSRAARRARRGRRAVRGRRGAARARGARPRGRPRAGRADRAVRRLAQGQRRLPGAHGGVPRAWSTSWPGWPSRAPWRGAVAAPRRCCSCTWSASRRWPRPRAAAIAARWPAAGRARARVVYWARSCRRWGRALSPRSPRGRC